jgi:hypothetical protein
MKKLLGLCACFFMLIMISCSEDSTDSQGSSDTGSSSHNTGKNCLGCHSFKVAGSVYNSEFSTIYSGAKIKITTTAYGSGTVLANISSDKTGNFYTNNSISFGSGVYVCVTGSGGTVKYMTSTITSGDCNSCHNGTTTSTIWAE